MGELGNGNGNGRQRIFDARLVVQIITLIVGLAISAAVTYATFTGNLAAIGVKLDLLSSRVDRLDDKVEKLDDRIDAIPRHQRFDLAL
jgi:hypothetical protein